MQIAYKYSYLARSLLLTVFYIPIFPFGVLITLGGLILSYLWEIFLFTREYKRPEMLNNAIGKFYAEHFVILLFIAGLGDYIFMHDAFDKKTFSLVNIILFGLLILVPYPSLLIRDYTKINKSDIKTKHIKDVYLSFYNDYQRQNPLTKKEGLTYYINKLYEHGLISKYTHDYALDNITKINVMELYYKMTYRLNLMKTQRALGNFNNKSVLSKSTTNKNILTNSKLRASLNDRIISEQENEMMDHPEKQVFNSQIQNFIKNSINLTQKTFKKKYYVNCEQIYEDTITEEEQEDEEIDNLSIIDYYNNPLLLNMGMSFPIRNVVYTEGE